MAIFSDSIGTGVPESNFLKQRIAGRVVREGEGDIYDGGHVGIMHSGVKIVTDSSKDWWFVMVSVENLVGRVDEVLSVCEILLVFEVLFNLVDVDLRG